MASAGDRGWGNRSFVFANSRIPRDTDPASSLHVTAIDKPLTLNELVVAESLIREAAGQVSTWPHLPEGTMSEVCSPLVHFSRGVPT